MTRRVLIAGGGIAGCAAAVALQHAGMASTIIEQRPLTTKDSGAFLRLNPNGLDALSAVDALAPVVQASFPLRSKQRWALDGQKLAVVSLSDPDHDRGLVARFILWACLRQALLTLAIDRGARYMAGARVTGADTGSRGIRAKLSDGRHLDGTVLVGADGINSAVRTIVDPSAPRPQFCNSRTIYGNTPHPEQLLPPATETLRSYQGPSGFLAYTTAARGTTYWFTNLKTSQPLTSTEPGTEHWQRQLLPLLKHDKNPTVPLVERASTIFAADDNALPRLPRWHTDHAVVIGDAAHVAPPASEQGASLAIEDAVVLAQCLRDQPVTSALQQFVQRRRERCELIIAAATGHRPPSWDPAAVYKHHIQWGKDVP
ncbi:FAD-dependent oxidoreductase [Amycolatopsis japonica]|uniref:FAD-dependent oxidoreductase n=1 Tax=Amycolatopsis japonica TaxID=208439 RepID=UPI0037B00318